MAHLQCNLNVSWRTQLISGIFYAALNVAILLIPWPEQDWPVWLILVALIALESILAQRRINKTKGQLTLLDKRSVRWAEQKWTMVHSPFVLSFGIFLSLRSELSGKKKLLWIAIDSLSKEQWRNLRYELLQNKAAL